MSATDKAAPLKDPLENFLGYQLRRAAFASIAPLTESFAGLGVSVTEAVLIRFVQANPGCTQSDIGRAIGVKRTNLVPIVSGLMANGLIERTAADRRSHSLFLTGKGVELQHQLDKLSQEHEQSFFGDIPDDTRQMLMQFFRSLRSKGEAAG